MLNVWFRQQVNEA